jgi:D-alanyl-D-alanine carboxypeptidase/D-alanyl-D-alanine-endopeptidase (penicillin-binding protein 4)
MTRFALRSLVLALFLFAGESRLGAADVVTRATGFDQLRAQLDAHVNAPRFSGALWGVKIMSLETGRVWFDHHADRLLSPASNCKPYAAALALDRLGSDYRIVTPLLATAKPDATGELRGDFIVSGRGDPSWKTRGTKKDFSSLFEPLVDVLAKAGVKRITGDVIADTTYFRGFPTGAGWTVDDLMDDYGAEISAVALEDNYADLRVTPAGKIGDPCGLAFVQPHTGLVLDNRTTTIAAGGKKNLTRVRLLGENVVHIFGELPLGAAEELIDVTVPRPATWFAAALKDALVRRGIRVDGVARSVRWPDASVVTASSVKLGEISSPPLRELIAAVLKPSQNLETDLIFAHLGEKFRAADAPALRTSEESAVLLLQEFFRANALPASEVRFEEGSGLSRNNLASANATVTLLQLMSTHTAAKDFYDALPIAGVDGTIRRRMKGTAAENNVHAKTGTLRYANSLAGYVTTAAGERLAFAAMLNRYAAPAGRTAAMELDGLAVLLAGFNARPGAAPAP